MYRFRIPKSLHWVILAIHISLNSLFIIPLSFSLLSRYFLFVFSLPRHFPLVVALFEGKHIKRLIKLTSDATQNSPHFSGTRVRVPFAGLCRDAMIGPYIIV